MRMRASEQIALQAQLLDEVDAAVILVEQYGGEGVVRYWSAGAERLYGYTAEEAVGRELDRSRDGRERPRGGCGACAPRSPTARRSRMRP